MKIFVIGSVSQELDIRRVANYLKELGHDVDFVKRQLNTPLSELVENAYDKIYEVDEVVAVPKTDGSLGEGTTYEVAFAKFVGTPVHIVNM